MNKKLFAGILFLALFLFLSSPLSAFHKAKHFDPESSQWIDVAEGELIVYFKPKKSDKLSRKKVLESAEMEELESLDFDEKEEKIARRVKIRHSPAEESQCQSKKECQKMAKLIEKLKKDPNIEWVEPNVIRKAFFSPNDPLYTTGATEEYNGVQQWMKQWFVDKTNLTGAWSLSTGKSTVLIAICDDGINSTHEDLAGKIVKQYDFYSNDTNAAHAANDIGHGTHVAGIAAAIKNNSLGIAGVSDSNLLIARVLGPDGGTDTMVANGIKWSADNGAKVINLSLGGAGKTLTLENAVNYATSKGAVVVAAAGNEALEGNPVSYPAAYNNVIAVAATDKNDVRGSFSNYGSYVDIAAPGVEILSTIPKNLSSANTGDTNGSGYTAWDGTSMATPFVSGVVSLLFALNPNLTFAEVENILYSTAKDLGSAGKDPYYGWGRIQPLNALQAVPQQSVAKVLISQFATRGSASASDEFVELYNPTANSISIAGWQLQYLSASGTTWSNRLTFPQGASIPANGYYLTANSAGYVSGTSGPAPDSWWGTTTGIADDGHLRIVDATGKEIDRVGYGTASQPEGGTPGAPNHGTTANSKSVGRKTDPSDTNLNRNDFETRASRNPKKSTLGTSSYSDFSFSSLVSLSEVVPPTDSPEGFQMDSSHPLLQQLAIELDLDAAQIENVRQLILSEAKRAALANEVTKLETFSEKVQEGLILTAEEKSNQQNILNRKKEELRIAENEVQEKLSALQESLGEKSYDWLEWLQEQRVIEIFVLKSASSGDVEATKLEMARDPVLETLSHKAALQKTASIARELEDTEQDSYFSQWKIFKQKSFETRYGLLAVLHGLELNETQEQILNAFRAAKTQLPQ